jgi:hypothetical protein
MKEIKIFFRRVIEMVTKNKTNTAKKNEVPGQGDLGQLILNSLRINNEDIMRTLVSKNTEDSLGFTDGQLREIQNLINAVGVTSEDKAMSQLLRYY